MPRASLTKLLENPPALWPRFSSTLHTPAVVARVGRVLGIFFTICFVTGVLSHYQYGPWHWLPEPASPTWGYRLTQGLHVITGTASIPLLVLKLWTVYPKLFQWPPAKSVLNGIERLSIGVFVTSALLEVGTGFINTLDWYPWPWFFTTVHYALAYIVFGSLLLHIACKLPIIRTGLATPLSPAPNEPEEEVASAGISRRGLLIASGAGIGVVAVTVAGATVTPLQKLALLAPRRADEAPQLHVPINRTAHQASSKAADVTTLAYDPSYRLNVKGRNPFELTLQDIEALPRLDKVFPLACVEGWSVSARWYGIPLLDLVKRAGGDENSHVHVNSIEAAGIYRKSDIFGAQLSRALLATHLNGERLTLDHGYPIRLIAPDRAGVLNTKWVNTITVS
jgi:Oxidoreductase molybdopterin binding domain